METTASSEFNGNNGLNVTSRILVFLLIGVLTMDRYRRGSVTYQLQSINSVPG